MTDTEQAGSGQAFHQIDRVFGGKPDAVKFTDPGDGVTGIIVEVWLQQATEYGTDTPKIDRQGQPVLDPVIVLSTGDGMRCLYVASWRMKQAIADAVKEAGAPGPRPGGQLMVRFTGTEKGKGGSQPAKNYEAAYDLPKDQGARPKLDEWLPMPVPPPPSSGPPLGPDDPPF